MEYMETNNPFTKILVKLRENGIDTHADGHKKDIARFLQYIDKRIEAADIPNDEKDLLREMIVKDIFPKGIN